MFRKMIAPVLAAGLVATVAASSQAPQGQQPQDRYQAWVPVDVPAEKIDADMNARIRKEGMENSKIMETMHYLTDVYGPRLTGSPNFDNAAKWAVKQMESWGMVNGKLEPWNWGREGWLNERASGHIISPVKDNLVFEVLAWTPSTKGTVTAPAVLVTPPTQPMSEADFGKYLADLGTKVKGAIVLIGEARTPAFVEVESPKRQDDAAVKASYLPPDPNAPARGGGRGGGRGDAGGGRAGGRGAAEATPGLLTPAQMSPRINDLIGKTAAIRVNDAFRRHEQIIAFSGGNYVAANAIPTVVMANEHYGRIARILAHGTPVTLEFTIVNKTYPDAKISYNATAEIRGTDKADEVVMMGGHLDSWHSSTGATDNAAGCSIMMEAARILKALGVQPRRTIRVALWGGEEQGLLGSQAYVEQHFGTYESPKPEFNKFSAYWNIDGGTGRVRGAGVFGPPEAAMVLSQILKPFEDYGVYGASASRGRNRGGTDSTSFNWAGLAGVGGRQDTIEYGSHTHHTNLDSYERIVVDDVKKNAVVTASLMYHLAMRDELLPRFKASDFPPPNAPAGRGRGGQ
jgi:Zn-dependent M28 family amino/carboxypeptidase